MCVWKSSHIYINVRSVFYISEINICFDFAEFQCHVGIVAKNGKYEFSDICY